MEMNKRDSRSKPSRGNYIHKIAILALIFSFGILLGNRTRSFTLESAVFFQSNSTIKEITVIHQAPPTIIIQQQAPASNIYGSLCPPGVTFSGTTTVAEIAARFCPEALADQHSTGSPVIQYLKGLSTGDYNETLKLRAFIYSAGPEMNGLSIREFGLLAAFSNKILEVMMQSDVTIEYPNLDVVLADLEKNQVFVERKLVYAVEFSGCGQLGNSRYGIYMALNLLESLKRVQKKEAEPLPPLIFYTWDASCIEASTHYPEMTVIDARPFSVLFPFCQRDIDSGIRIALTWELLKRGISIYNADADVVFYKSFPKEYEAADIAGAMYTYPEANTNSITEFLSNEVYLFPNYFNNFGQWWWKASPAGIDLFREYMQYAVLDYAGSDPNPLKRWHCDDQNVMQRVFTMPRITNRIITIYCGDFSKGINVDGDFHMRILDPEQFPMAPLAIRGWTSDKTVTLHMAGYGSWKIFGLRALGLWFLDDKETWSPNGGFPDSKSFVRLSSTMTPAISHEEEVERLVMLIGFAQMNDLGFVMPSFDCQFAPYKNSVYKGPDTKCTFEFHYDYGELIKLTAPFIFENEIPKVFSGQKVKERNINLSSIVGAKNCEGCLLTLTMKKNDDVEFLRPFMEMARQSLQANPRVHGCC